MRLRSQQHGFSYVELLISMAVVLVLAAVVLGPSESTARKRKLAACAETMRRLHLSLTIYANEHDGAFPIVDGAKSSGDVLNMLVPTYTADKSILQCEGGGYSYSMGLTKNDKGMLVADRFDSSRGTPSFPEKGNHGAQSGNVLFADGHVEQFEAGETRGLRMAAHTILLNP